MKKILIFIFLLLIPFIVNAETCDNSKVTLELLGDGNQTGFVTEKSQPVVNGKDINVDLKMAEQGDSIEYKISVKNDSEADYEIDKNSFNINSDYINYTLSFDDNSTIVKAGTSKVATLRVEYANPVPADVLLAGPVIDNKTIKVNLSSGQDIENPKTGVESLLIAFVLTLSVSSVALFILNKKGYATLAVIIGIAVVIPVTVHAVCKCELNLTSSVEITNNPKFCFRYYTGYETYENRYYEYEDGMSAFDYVTSAYYNDDDWMLPFYFQIGESFMDYSFPNTFETINGEIIQYNDASKVDEINRYVAIIDNLRPKEEGCYYYRQLK